MTERIIINAISLLRTIPGLSAPILLPGRISNHATTARVFINAAKMKNEFAVPVALTRCGMVTELTKNGKIIAPVAEPIFPSMFIAAETVPEFSPPISMHNDQLGEMVISTPKKATENNSVNSRADVCGISVIRTNPKVARVNPAIAGIFRERIIHPLEYRTVPSHPENHWAIIPTRRGIGAYNSAPEPHCETR